MSTDKNNVSVVVSFVPGKGTRTFLYETVSEVSRDFAALDRDDVVKGDAAAALITLIPVMIDGQGMRLTAEKSDILREADSAVGRQAVRKLEEQAARIQERIVRLREIKRTFQEKVLENLLKDEAKRRRITVEELTAELQAPAASLAG